MALHSFMVEHKEFNYLYLGKLGLLGKLANSTKKNFGKPKLFNSFSFKGHLNSESEFWILTFCYGFYV